MGTTTQQQENSVEMQELNHAKNKQSLEQQQTAEQKEVVDLANKEKAKNDRILALFRSTGFKNVQVNPTTADKETTHSQQKWRADNNFTQEPAIDMGKAEGKTNTYDVTVKGTHGTAYNYKISMDENNHFNSVTLPKELAQKQVLSMDDKEQIAHLAKLAKQCNPNNEVTHVGEYSKAYAEEMLKQCQQEGVTCRFDQAKISDKEGNEYNVDKSGNLVPAKQSATQQIEAERVAHTI